MMAFKKTVWGSSEAASFTLGAHGVRYSTKQERERERGAEYPQQQKQQQQQP